MAEKRSRVQSNLYVSEEFFIWSRLAGWAVFKNKDVSHHMRGRERRSKGGERKGKSLPEAEAVLLFTKHCYLLGLICNHNNESQVEAHLLDPLCLRARP